MRGHPGPRKEEVCELHTVAEEGADGDGFLGIRREGVEVVGQATVGGEEGASGGGISFFNPDFILFGVMGEGEGRGIVCLRGGGR
jgi:hypothetical protein